MSRGTEITRLGLQRIIDQAMGLNRVNTRTNAQREADIRIINRNMLPVLVVPSGPVTPEAVAASGAAARVQVGSAFAFLAGYSAPAGSSAATPDATGRGGDTAVTSRAYASGGARGSAVGVIVFPGSGAASGGSTGTGLATVV
jgi:hypothetical protein